MHVNTSIKSPCLLNSYMIDYKISIKKIFTVKLDSKIAKVNDMSMHVHLNLLVLSVTILNY